MSVTPTNNAITSTPRLRGGPHRLSREQVRSIQRERILSAALDTVEDVGYPRMTVARVIAGARVSRKTFYEIFPDIGTCFLVLFDQALSQAILLASEAYRGERSWRDGIRSALARLLDLIDEQPRLAKLVVIESLAAGRPVLRRRAQLLRQFAEIIDEGRVMRTAPHEPPRLTAEAVVGAVSALLHTRLLEERDEPLTGLLGSMMSMIVLPYLGPEAASRELRRPARPSRCGPGSRAPAGRSDPLEGLEMRLTYRTMRVLIAVSEHPGASNREVAARSDVADAGQISRLLARLARLGLTENTGGPQANREANAWTLTPSGQELLREIGRLR